MYRHQYQDLINNVCEFIVMGPPQFVGGLIFFITFLPASTIGHNNPIGILLDILGVLLFLTLIVVGLIYMICVTPIVPLVWIALQITGIFLPLKEG